VVSDPDLERLARTLEEAMDLVNADMRASGLAVWWCAGSGGHVAAPIGQWGET
jgi:hypothetical protein